MILAEKLKESVLQAAIQGKITEQLSSDSSVDDLLKKIEKVKDKYIEEWQLKKTRAKKNKEEEDFPFEIPDNWRWQRLGAITVINPRNYIDDNSEVSFIPMNLIADGYRDEYTFEKRLWKDVKTGFTHIAENDIGIAKITPCFQNRKSAIFKGLINGYGAGTTELNIVRVFPDTILSEYLLWMFKTAYFIDGGVATYKGTAGQQRVNKNYTENFWIPIPPVEEQQRIIDRIKEILPLLDKYKEMEDQLQTIKHGFAKELTNSIIQSAIQGKETEQREDDSSVDKLLESIAETKKQLIKNKEIKKEAVSEPIENEENLPFEVPDNWRWERLGNLCEKIGAGSTPKGGAINYVQKGVPFFREQNIYNDGLREEGLVFITPEMNDKKKGSQVRAKDILLNITGGSIGRCALVPDDFETGNVNQHVLIIRCIDSRIGKYVHTVLNSPYIQNMIMDKQVGDKEGLSATKTKNFPIPIPPIEEQERIVTRIEGLLPLCHTIEIE